MNFSELQTQLAQALSRPTAKLCEKSKSLNGDNNNQKSPKPPGRPPNTPNSFPGRPPGSPPGKSLRSKFPGTVPGPSPNSRPTRLNFPGTAPTPCPPLRRCVTGPVSPPPLPLRPISTIKLEPIPVGPIPPVGLQGRKLLWQNLPDSRTIGSIWETLIIDDAMLPPSNSFRYECPIMRPIEYPSRTTSASRSPNTPRSSGRPDSPVIHLTRLEPDFKGLTTLFFEEIEARKKDSDKSDNSRPATVNPIVTVLDPKRRQNLEICLKGLGLLDSLTPLLETVVKLSPFIDSSTSKEHLSAESLQMLIGLYPTADEESLLNMHLSKTPAPIFGKAESFLIELMKIKSFKIKAECCLIHLTFAEEARACQHKVVKLDRCLTRVLESLNKGALRAVLALTLRAGNYLNYGNKKGSARGFSLDSLPQLRTVKSIDGSTNFLRVIAQTVENQNTLYWTNLKDSIGTCQIAMDVTFEDILALANQLQNKIRKIEKEIERVGSDDEQKFVNVFSEFVHHSKLATQSIQTTIKSIEDKLLNLLKLFAERGKAPKDGMDVLKRLSCFWNDFHSAHLENHEKEQKEREQLLRLSRRLGNQTARQSRATPEAERKVPMTARPALSQTDNIIIERPNSLIGLQKFHSLSSQLTETGSQQPCGVPKATVPKATVPKQSKQTTDQKIVRSTSINHKKPSKLVASDIPVDHEIQHKAAPIPYRALTRVPYSRATLSQPNPSNSTYQTSSRNPLFARSVGPVRIPKLDMKKVVPNTPDFPNPLAPVLPTRLSIRMGISPQISPQPSRPQIGSIFTRRLYEEQKRRQKSFDLVGWDDGLWGLSANDAESVEFFSNLERFNSEGQSSFTGPGVESCKSRRHRLMTEHDMGYRTPPRPSRYSEELQMLYSPEYRSEYSGQSSRYLPLGQRAQYSDQRAQYSDQRSEYVGQRSEHFPQRYSEGVLDRRVCPPTQHLSNDHNRETVRRMSEVSLPSEKGKKTSNVASILAGARNMLPRRTFSSSSDQREENVSKHRSRFPKLFKQ